MKLEELLDCSAAQLEAMTDAELLEHFKPFLNITRPELAPRPKTNTANELFSPEKMAEMKFKIAKLKAMGVDVDEKSILKKRK